MINDSEYCIEIPEREFNKLYVMTNEQYEDFNESTICSIYGEAN